MAGHYSGPVSMRWSFSTKPSGHPGQSGDHRVTCHNALLIATLLNSGGQKLKEVLRKHQRSIDKSKTWSTRQSPLTISSAITLFARYAMYLSNNSCVMGGRM